MTPEPIKIEIAKTALRKLFMQSYFDICTVKSICDMLNRPLGGDMYRAMHPLHCISYADMSPDVKEWLFESTLKYISEGSEFNLTLIEIIQPKQIAAPVRVAQAEPEPAKRGIFKRLGLAA